MNKIAATIAHAGRSCTRGVTVEPDKDAWHAWCPALQGYGAATWGTARIEPLRHIQEMAAMVVAEPLPADKAGSAGSPDVRCTASSGTFWNCR